MRYTAIIILLFVSFLVTPLFGQSFTNVLHLYSGASSSDVTIGIDPSATNGFDLSFDMPALPMPIFYAYSYNEFDTTGLLSELSTDIRSALDTVQVWKIRVANATTATVTMSWGAFPPFGEAYIGVCSMGEEPDSWASTSTVSSVEFSLSEEAQIKFIHEVEMPSDSFPPYVSYWDPEDGDTVDSDTATITIDIVDDSTGVDSASISLVVDTLDVSFFTMKVPIPHGYRLTYTPFSLLPYPTDRPVRVVVSACDLSYPPNCFTDSIHFYVAEGETTGTPTISGYVYLIDAPPETTLEGSMVMNITALTADTTDIDGFYKLPVAMFSPEQSLFAFRAGYIPAETTVVTLHDTTVNFYLSRSVIGSYTVSGVVTFSDGSLDRSNVVVSIDSSLSDTTGEDGFYSISGVGMGSHEIRAEKTFYIPISRTITVYTDTVINFTLERATPAQVLIYDFDDGDTPCDSGRTGAERAIALALSSLDYSYEITPQNASLTAYGYDLSVYDAVIVVTGTQGGESSVIPDEDIQLLIDYIDSGGKIYWEGADFGYDYYAYGGGTPIRRNLFSRFGISWSANGRSMLEGNVLELYGESSFFGEDIVIEYEFMLPADQYIDEIRSDGAEIILQSQEEPSPISSRGRASAYEHDGAKLVFSACYTGGMHSATNPQIRESYIRSIMDFLDVHPGVDEKRIIPEELSISAFPNPFNSQLILSIETDKATNGRLIIYNMLGQPVVELLSGIIPAGKTYITWQPKENLASGVYFYRLSGEGEASGKVIYLK
ncbi:T9SS type A sorting domain-containing protein [bacterium]|nr:T9SS type A sorting domain-containing protein [bacterium]